MPGLSAVQREQVAAEIRAGRAPGCPQCGTTLSVEHIKPKPTLAYVRTRLWLLCPTCKLTGTIDAPRS